MNITKNLKISIIFMTSVLVSTVLCISLLYQLASHSSQTAIHTGMRHNMDTYLQAETSAVQDFVSSSEQALILFSKSPVVKEYLKNQIYFKKLRVIPQSTITIWKTGKDCT